MLIKNLVPCIHDVKHVHKKPYGCVCITKMECAEKVVVVETRMGTTVTTMTTDIFIKQSGLNRVGVLKKIRRRRPDLPKMRRKRGRPKGPTKKKEREKEEGGEGGGREEEVEGAKNVWKEGEGDVFVIVDVKEKRVSAL